MEEANHHHIILSAEMNRMCCFNFALINLGHTLQVMEPQNRVSSQNEMEMAEQYDAS